MEFIENVWQSTRKTTRNNVYKNILRITEGSFHSPCVFEGIHLIENVDKFLEELLNKECKIALKKKTNPAKISGDRFLGGILRKLF